MQINSLTPYLHYEDGGAAADWLARVLGFTEIARFIDAAGVVREAEMTVGNTELWFAGHGAGYWEAHNRRPHELTLVWVDDIDTHYARAIAAGGEADPPADKPYAVREYTIVDPEGYKWGIMQRLDTPIRLQEGWTEVRPRT